MKTVSMAFPDLGIRVTGSERAVNKKERIIHAVTESYVAYNKMNEAQSAVFNLLEMTASETNTLAMIDMTAHIESLKKGVAQFEEAYSALYDAHIEEEIPDECFSNDPNDVL